MRSSALRSVTVMSGDSSGREGACYRRAAVDAEDDRTEIDPRANPWAMLAALPLFSGLPTEVVDAAVAELEWISLPGGRLLFEAGSPADAVYFVVSGCLGVHGPGGELVGRIAAGECVGEMGLIVSRPRTATVRALRDSELAMLSAGTFERVLLGHPAAILRLARLAMERLEHAGVRERRQMTPRTIALVPQDGGLDLARPAKSLVTALSAYGRVDLVTGERAGSHSPQWFHELESRNDFVVYAADAEATPWSRRCLRQADLLLLAAQSDREPGGWAGVHWQEGAWRRAELMLLHDGKVLAGSARRWRELHPDVRVHHVRGEQDYPRLVRILTGRAVGLVLSGGGARGFAHLGVVKALREHGVPIDLAGG